MSFLVLCCLKLKRLLVRLVRAFTIRSENIINGLEAYAITKTHDFKRYSVENTVSPKYEIDEYDISLIAAAYEEIQFIMATLGYKMDDSQHASAQVNILHTTRNGISGIGLYNGDRFDVLEGSEIDMSYKCHSPAMEKQRQTALNDRNIKLVEEKYILKTTVSFSSPSSAAMFVLGGSANG